MECLECEQRRNLVYSYTLQTYARDASFPGTVIRNGDHIMPDTFTREDRDQLYALLTKLLDTLQAQTPAETHKQHDLTIAKFMLEYRFKMLPWLFPGDDPTADDDLRT